MAIGGVRLSSQAQRFAAAGLIVVVVAVSVWLFGRPEPPPATVAVVATTEAWPAGHMPGGYTTVEVPATAAGLFVTPAQLDGRVPAVPVPAGAVVAAAMLADPAAVASDPEAARVAVGVDLTLWPAPGPAAGDTAVLARHPGGCASAVLPVLAATEHRLVVEAAPDLVSRLAGGEAWSAWRSPAAGWPECEAPVAPTASDPEAAVVAVGVDLSLWPAPGPEPGDTAVLARHPGGCASAVLPVLAATEHRLVVEATPDLVSRLAGGEAWSAWRSPAAGWPECEAPVAPTASDPEAAVVAVGVDLSLWPAPGPEPGDTAVLSWHPGGCASAVLAVLAASEHRLTVEASPDLAEGLGPYQWWAWEAPAEGWPRCERPAGAAGIN